MLPVIRVHDHFGSLSPAIGVVIDEYEKSKDEREIEYIVHVFQDQPQDVSIWVSTDQRKVNFMKGKIIAAQRHFVENTQG